MHYIAEDKLTRYLLVKRDKDDKSAWLARAGFIQDNWELLTKALKDLILREEAVRERESDYGVMYRVEGTITGPNGIALDVAAFWLESRADGRFRFITLVPRRGGTS